jgi:hypothetical protein
MKGSSHGWIGRWFSSHDRLKTVSLRVLFSQRH